MIIYSEHGKAIGATRRSPCGCMTELVLQVEPWRTMLQNVLTDYALEVPFGEANTYRLDWDEEGERWLVKAKSVLEKELWVDVAEVREDERGLPVFSLLRVRPRYSGRRKRRDRKTNQGEGKA